MERNKFLMESLVLSTNRLITLLEQQKTDQKNIQVSTSETLPEWVTLELAVEKKRRRKSIHLQDKALSPALLWSQFQANCWQEMLEARRCLGMD